MISPNRIVDLMAALRKPEYTVAVMSRVKAILESRGENLCILAKRLGRNRSQVYRWSYGTRLLSPAHLKRISEELDVPVIKLLPEEDGGIFSA